VEADYYLQETHGIDILHDYTSHGITVCILIWVLELLHTHIGFIFPKVFPCLLVIISHYPVSYILGENIPPREYSLSVDTLV
jgi:hypothetical protein